MAREGASHPRVNDSSSQKMEDIELTQAQITAMCSAYPPHLSLLNDFGELLRFLCHALEILITFRIPEHP
jgi:hypothetical protein